MLTILFKKCSGLGLIFLFMAPIYGQRIAVDISSVECFDTVNRHISIKKTDGDTSYVFLNGKPNQGIAWLKNIDFSFGVIEFDVKGKNAPQESFVGLAYHGINDSTYEAIYFRPFNFVAANKESKSHCVQYISMPEYDWYNLRHLYKGEYESGLNRRVDPDSWVHVKLEIAAKMVRVFVNGNTMPALVIRPLSPTGKGRMGFWVGNGSDGSFSHLIVDEKRLQY